MTTQTITPANKADWLALRSSDITSTEISALFGCSPYNTAFEIWHRKKSGMIVEIEENERMKWGNLLQDAISQGISKEQGWIVLRTDDYQRIPELRIGASFDNLCYADLPGAPPSHLLEIKNVDSLIFKEGWIVEGDHVEAPVHIEFQVQHQLLVSGLPVCYIGALVGGNRLVLIKRERDEKVIEAIKTKVAAFWKSIEANEEPKPDFEKDADFISKLMGYAEPGKVIQSDTEIDALALEYKKHADAMKGAEAAKDAIKAQILLKIGDAEKVEAEGFSVTAGLIGPVLIEAHERKGYRNFRVNWKKEKKAGAK